MTQAPARLKPGTIAKPRLRGWLHTYAFFVAIVSGLVLCSLAATRPGLAPILSCVIYSFTVCGLFGVSALYHRGAWTQRGYATMRRVDHSMIFIFIAGTYTPFAALLLDPASATLILAVVWGGTLAGVLVKVFWLHAPRWVSAPLYVALGWVAVAVLPGIHHGGGTAALVLLLVGGAIYSAGAVFYAMRRPNPWPAVFGHHELFHACTVVAAACQHIALYLALYA